MYNEKMEMCPDFSRIFIDDWVAIFHHQGDYWTAIQRFSLILATSVGIHFFQLLEFFYQKKKDFITIYTLQKKYIHRNSLPYTQYRQNNNGIKYV